MPRSIRLLASLLIGVTGAILWIGSMVCLASGLVFEVAEPDMTKVGLLITWGISMALGLVGFSMISAVEFFNGARIFRMPSHRLFPYLCLRLLQQALAVAFAGLLLATLVSAALRHHTDLGFWAAATGLALAGLIVAIRWQSHFGEKWRMEVPDEPPLPAGVKDSEI